MDLHLVFIDHDAFKELSLLFKRGLSQAVLHPLTERFKRLGDGGEFIVALDICLSMTHLPSN